MDKLDKHTFFWLHKTAKTRSKGYVDKYNRIYRLELYKMKLNTLWEKYLAAN
jgi:hypothetical protein